MAGKLVFPADIQVVPRPQLNPIASAVADFSKPKNPSIGDVGPRRHPRLLEKGMCSFTAIAPPQFESASTPQPKFLETAGKLLPPLDSPGHAAWTVERHSPGKVEQKVARPTSRTLATDEPVLSFPKKKTPNRKRPLRKLVILTRGCVAMPH